MRNEHAFLEGLQTARCMVQSIKPTNVDMPLDRRHLASHAGSSHKIPTEGSEPGTTGSYPVSGRVAALYLR